MAVTKLDQVSPVARQWVDKVLKAHPELSEAGKVLLVEAARARATIAAAEEALTKDGHIIDGLHGPKQHPAVTVARQARAQLLQLLIALDLSEQEEA